MVYDPEDREKEVRRHGENVDAVARRFTQWRKSKAEVEKAFDQTMSDMIVELQSTAKKLKGDRT